MRLNGMKLGNLMSSELNPTPLKQRHAPMLPDLASGYTDYKYEGGQKERNWSLGLSKSIRSNNVYNYMSPEQRGVQ